MPAQTWSATMGTSPLLGRHSEEVLCEMLGVSQEEIESL